VTIGRFDSRAVNRHDRRWHQVIGVVIEEAYGVIQLGINGS